MSEAENTPAEEPAELAADRDLPSVASGSNNQKIIGAAVIGLAAVAMIFVVISDKDKNEPKSLTAPKNIAFKTPPGSSPYIPPSIQGADDSLGGQKDQAMQQAALAMAMEEQKKQERRAISPQVVYDQRGTTAPGDSDDGNNTLTGSGEASTAAAANASLMPSAGAGANSDPNVAFATENANKDVETAKASQLKNLHTLIAQGAMIPGVLETAIASDLPGMVRAIVSENVYSFDGTNLLIPQGTRLVGQYRSGMVRGQSRVFIIWNRLIRNDGVSINIGSYGADDLGRSGLAGDVDTHFFERFGSSVMLSMIDSGFQALANSTKSQATTNVAINTGNDFSNAATIALQNSVNIPPTINVDQGTRINVFVGKDLDFSHVSGIQQAE